MDIFEKTFIHKTPSSSITLNLKSTLISIDELKIFENKSKFDKLCQFGCVNFNKKWSCPPHSPSFSTYSSGYKYALLVLIYCDLNQFSYTKTEYMKIKASNSILKSRLDTLSRQLEETFNGKMISNGSCRLCKPCSLKSNNKTCKRPHLMRYSLESLGLDVDSISKSILNHELKWYENKNAPQYSTTVSAIMLNENIDNLFNISSFFHDFG